MLEPVKCAKRSTASEHPWHPGHVRPAGEVVSASDEGDGLASGGPADLPAALQAALERKPAVSVPAHFAGRVATEAARLPQHRPAPETRYARLIAFAAAVVVVAALFALASRAPANFSSLRFDLELVLLLQLAALAWWLTRSPDREF